jgi:hypothetical protein
MLSEDQSKGDENSNSRFSAELQYNRFSEDWRHVNTILWQLPSIAVSIMAGIVAVAYQILGDWPRILLLSAGSLFMFVLAIAIVRQIVFANTRLRFLQYLEYKSNTKKFPTGLRDDAEDISYILNDMPTKELTFDPDVQDDLIKFLSKRSSRKWLTYSIFILSILLAVAAIVESIYIYIIN